MVLSRLRADAAAKYLVAGSIDAGFLDVQGLGVYPDGEKTDPENIAANDIHGRIVELEFLVDPQSR